MDSAALDAVKAMLKNRDEDIADLERENAELKERAKEWDRGWDSLEKERDKLAAECSSRRDFAAERMRENERLQARVGDLEEGWEGAESRIADLEAQLEGVVGLLTAAIDICPGATDTFLAQVRAAIAGPLCQIHGSTKSPKCTDCFAAITKPASGRIIGQHWLEVAAERVAAGEPEAEVLRDYGVVVTRPGSGG